MLAEAKPKKPRQDDDQPLVLEYDLHSLPTAQHKAGLAGLLMVIESMRRRKMADLPEVLALDNNGATVSFTRQSAQALFDDLYAAQWVEVSSGSKWPGREPKRVEEHEIENNGTKKKAKRFIYDAVRPNGAFLDTLYPPNAEVWVKQWRDMLWGTLRGIPKTRIVFEERANNKHSSLALKAYIDLTKWNAEAAKGKRRTEPIVSSLFIGAQDVNAERVPFQGETPQNVLLHFWLVPSLVFCPRRFDEKRGFEPAGYCLAIPEPFLLEEFVDEALHLLGSLDTATLGYRPRAAVIDIPEEGGLQYLYSLVRDRIDRKDISYSLVSVEVYHLEKRGNSVRMLTAERIQPDTRMIRDYDAMRTQCRNPLFKSRRVKNLLARHRWFTDMQTEFATHPWSHFVYTHGRTSPRLPFFGTDVRQTLNALTKDLEITKGESVMSEEERDNMLALRVYHLVQQYARRRAEEKAGVKYAHFKTSKGETGKVVYPAKYREAMEKVCGDAFLAMRGRNDRDFVAYFAGTICSVPQWLPEKEYLEVSQALTTDWDKVKTLAMLALSACSYLPQSKEETQTIGE